MTTTSPPATQNGSADSTLNPFAKRTAPLATVEVESQRAIAETQAAMVIAQKFRRNPAEAMDRILQAFTRPTLAEKAMYAYARGGTDITGPSIRAAEAIAQEYGNLQFGVRELEQRAGASTVEAFAWDVQTNTRSSKVFQVPHVRHTRQGQTRLEDPRDIYEMVANQGARRLRACILSVIPSDVIEAAIKQAETTLRTKVQVTPELIQSLADKFAGVGVSRRMLETKIQRRLEAVTPALVVQLGKIYNAIEDGVASVSDHFQIEDSPTTVEGEQPKSRTDKLADRLSKKNAQASAGDDKPATPASDAATPTVEATKPAQVAEEIDEKQKTRDLRKSIIDAWNPYDAARTQAQVREYAKASLTEFTLPQLEEFFEKTPQLMKSAGITAGEAPAE